MGFSSPIAGGGGNLIRPVFKSPDFLTGVSGWAIYRDGSAEFNNLTLRGSWTVQEGNAQMIGDVVVLPANPYDPAPQLKPVITFNPDTALYTSGYVYAKGSSLVFGSPDLISGSLPPATAALIQDNTAGFDYFEVTAEALALYHHDRFATEVNIVASTAAIAPANVQTVVSANGSVTNSQYSRLLIMAGWHGVTLGAPAAAIGANRVTMSLVMNGTTVRECRLLPQATAQPQCGGTLIYVTPPSTFANLNSFDLKMTHDGTSTAGTVSCVATAASPAWIAVKGF